MTEPQRLTLASGWTIVITTVDADEGVYELMAERDGIQWRVQQADVRFLHGSPVCIDARISSLRPYTARITEEP